MLTLCYGGSFNPVHHAHLICGRAAAEAIGATRLLLIPNRQSPHKRLNTDVAPAADRLAMCRLATAGEELFAIDDLELSRPGPSYTIDTVRTLAARGDGPVHWLIGGDQLPALSQWHRSDALLTEARFVVMARPGWTTDWDTLPLAVRQLRDRVVPAPLLQISSTDVRRRVAAGLPISYLTPPAVADYIAARGFYRRTSV